MSLNIKSLIHQSSSDLNLVQWDHYDVLRHADLFFIVWSVVVISGHPPRKLLRSAQNPNSLQELHACSSDQRISLWNLIRRQ